MKETKTKRRGFGAPAGDAQASGTIGCVKAPVPLWRNIDKT
jgi:hypothetical protein